MKLCRTCLVLAMLWACQAAVAKELEFFLYEVLSAPPMPNTRTYILGCQPTNGQQWEIGDSIETHVQFNLQNIPGASFVMHAGKPLDTIDVMLPPEHWDPALWPRYCWISDPASAPNIYPPLPGYDKDIDVAKANTKEIDVTVTSQHTEETEDEEENQDKQVTPEEYRKACGAVWEALYKTRGMKQIGFSMTVTNTTSEDADDRIVPIGTSGWRGSYYELEFFLDRYDGSVFFQQIVPEPSSLGLLTVAAMCLLRRPRA